MLKFTYTETGIHLERLAQSLEEFIALRVLICMRVNEGLIIEPGTAAFLLPLGMSELPVLTAIATNAENGLSLSQSDREFLEVSLQGTWLSSQPNREEGVFLATLPEAIEVMLLKLWQDAFAYQSARQPRASERTH